MSKSSELLSVAPDHTELVSRPWWDDPRQDVDVAERTCRPCHGRGVTRWDEDCPECGGLGVLFD
jgi:RecJ-like exonuclease